MTGLVLLDLIVRNGYFQLNLSPHNPLTGIAL
jgi:hypothetical protein